MDLGISGKRALVLGGSKGIGLAVARQLAREGCSVAIVARGEAAISQAVRELEHFGGAVQGIVEDLTDIGCYARIIGTLKEGAGAPDIVVFLPPNPCHGSFLERTEDDFAAAFHEQVLCLGRMVRECLPHMQAKSWGRFVIVGSGSTKEPMRGQLGFDYALTNVTRMAALRLCKQIALEVAPFGITINTIATGSIDTELFQNFFTERAREAGVPADEFIGNIIAKVPARRMGTPDEMAGLCLYLCSDIAGYTTGENILCDGGLINTPM